MRGGAAKDVLDERLAADLREALQLGSGRI
jgi:hypothetical protein